MVRILFDDNPRSAILIDSTMFIMPPSCNPACELCNCKLFNNLALNECHELNYLEQPQYLLHLAYFHVLLASFQVDQKLSACAELDNLPLPVHRES